jgi:hypothetical protein
MMHKEGPNPTSKTTPKVTDNNHFIDPIKMLQQRIKND